MYALHGDSGHHNPIVKKEMIVEALWIITMYTLSKISLLQQQILAYNPNLSIPLAFSATESLQLIQLSHTAHYVAKTTDFSRSTYLQFVFCCYVVAVV